MGCCETRELPINFPVSQEQTLKVPQLNPALIEKVKSLVVDYQNQKNLQKCLQQNKFKKQLECNSQEIEEQNHQTPLEKSSSSLLLPIVDEDCLEIIPEEDKTPCCEDPLDDKKIPRMENIKSQQSTITNSEQQTEQKVKGKEEPFLDIVKEESINLSQAPVEFSTPACIKNNSYNLPEAKKKKTMDCSHMISKIDISQNTYQKPLDQSSITSFTLENPKRRCTKQIGSRKTDVSYSMLLRAPEVWEEESSQSTVQLRRQNQVIFKSDSFQMN